MLSSVCHGTLKEDIVFGRKISLKVICVKKKLNCNFAIIFVVINIHIYKLFKSILNDVETTGNGEINTVSHFSSAPLIKC